MAAPLTWQYGVTTVPGRFNGVLQRTLASLALAGFDKPRLFVDGWPDDGVPKDMRGKGYEWTYRDNIKTYGNWILTAWELYLRSPRAQRYAIFQDDFVTYKNLRGYLDRCKFPEEGYWNLYTFPMNNKEGIGWHLSNQRGKGAVALVFSNKALRHLLGQPYMVNRPLDLSRGHESVDGAVISCMRDTAWKEFVHNPSLVQHQHGPSMMGHRVYPQADTFRGEEFDALDLLKCDATKD